MNGIKSSQLFTMLICVRMFGVICSPDRSDACQMWGTAISSVIQFIAVLPMLYLYRQEDFRLMEDKVFCKPVKALYIVFLILWGSGSFGSLWQVSKSVYFPIDSSLMGGLILAAVCVYTASTGLKAAARSSVFMAGLIVLALVMIAVGALPKAELNNFTPEVKLNNVVKCAISDFCDSGELVLCFLLLSFTKDSPDKSVKGFIGTKLILVESISIIEITVLGKIMDIADFPFFTAGALSQPFSIQRADAVYMLLFTLLCVMTATIQIVLSSKLLGELFPTLRYKPLLSSILMIAVSGVRQLGSADLSPVIGIMTVLLAVVIPLTMLLRIKSKDSDNPPLRT